MRDADDAACLQRAVRLLGGKEPSDPRRNIKIIIPAWADDMLGYAAALVGLTECAQRQGRTPSGKGKTKLHVGAVFVQNKNELIEQLQIEAGLVILTGHGHCDGPRWHLAHTSETPGDECWLIDSDQPELRGKVRVSGLVVNTCYSGKYDSEFQSWLTSPEATLIVSDEAVHFHESAIFDNLFLMQLLYNRNSNPLTPGAISDAFGVAQRLAREVWPNKTSWSLRKA